MTAESQATADQAEPEDAVSTASPARRISRGRLILVNFLIGVTTLLLIVAVFSVWANRMLFNPDNWSHTSTQLLQNEKIRSTTANYLLDQLYANVNVASLLKSELPPQLQGLASPIAGAVRNAAVRGVEFALERPRVQSLWAQANRAADHAFIAIAKGGTGAVTVQQGEVKLNLASIIDDVAARLGLPSDVSSKLPPNIAQLTVLKSNQLKYVQKGGNAIRGLALWLTIFCPLLYALAILLATGRRRRTLMTVGSAAVFAGVVVLLGRSLLESNIAGALTNDASLQPTITAVVTIMTGMLSEIAGACIFVGVPLIAAGWFAGPARVAVSGREAVAPFLRERPVETYAIVLVVMALIFIWDPIPATGKPAGMIVFTLLALLGTYVLRRQTAREFPDARPGAATQKLRARVAETRRRRQQSKASPDSARLTVPEQLRQLADLRDRGAMSPGEYEAGKAHLLHGG